MIQNEHHVRVSAALQKWNEGQEASLNRRQSRQERISNMSAFEDINAPDARSGIFLAFDREKIVCILTGVYPQRKDLGEQKTFGCASAHRTPSGVPVLHQKIGRVLVVPRKRMHEIEDQMQIHFVEIPLDRITQLAASEGSTWLRLSTEKRLELLDCVVSLYQMRRRA